MRIATKSSYQTANIGVCMILNFGPSSFKLTSTGCGASDAHTLTTFEDNDCTTASGTYEVTGTMTCTTVAEFYASVNCLAPG